MSLVERVELPLRHTSDGRAYCILINDSEGELAESTRTGASSYRGVCDADHLTLHSVR